MEIMLRQLRYFDALADHSRFGRAAAACGVTQPALSMQIKELEDAFGSQLVERGARQVRLTRLLLLEEGHCFRDQALYFCKMQSSLPREALDASSLSTLVQMVGAGMGVTFIPEMAAGVETRSASVSVARFRDPQPSRTIGMIWRKKNPLAAQLSQLSEVVSGAADALRESNRGHRRPISGAKRHLAGRYKAELRERVE
jgi:DNA-binding transcriptional LysR family regulator